MTIIKDYSKLRDWELARLVKKNDEQAIAEAKRRN